MLFIDIGSTYTKLVAVDTENVSFVATASAPTTVSDVSVGFRNALNKLQQMGVNEAIMNERYASSSAAGGLRMVAVGLVPSLTVEAARRAAFGAGAKVVGTYSFKLNRRQIEEIVGLEPDMILLAGGTDGGDTETVLHNADRLANSSLSVPVVMAGNSKVADDVATIFELKGKYLKITDNVMPEMNKLNIEPVREVIREIFIDRIIVAKGLDKINEYISGIAFPTPLAVLESVKTLQEAIGQDVIAIDIGGATTDVYSVGFGMPSDAKVVLKGLPETFAKRTVEGDLGVRHNIPTIIESVGESEFIKMICDAGHQAPRSRCNNTLCMWAERPESIANDEFEQCLDMNLASCAAQIAVERHVGHIEQIWTPEGRIMVQYGKDLTKVKILIGTGGPLINSPNPEKILKATLYDNEKPLLLKPRQPSLYIDGRYVLFSIGLLRTVNPNAARQLAKKYLQEMKIS